MRIPFFYLFCNVWIAAAVFAQEEKGGTLISGHTGTALAYWDKRSGMEGVAQALARHDGYLYVATSQHLYVLDANGKPQAVEGMAQGQKWVLLKFDTGNGKEILLAGTSSGIYTIQGIQAMQIFKGRHSLALCQSKQDPRRLFSTDGTDNFVSLLFKNGKWESEGRWEGMSQHFRSIAEGKDGTLWLSTFADGIIKALPDTANILKPKKIKSYGLAEGLPALSACKPFWFQGQMIWGTPKGLFHLSEKTDRFEPFCGLDTRFCQQSQGITLFQETAEGRIYLAPETNLKEDIGFLKPAAKGSYEWIFKPFKPLPQIASIRALLAEKEGIFWIAGSEGLFRYDEKKDSIQYETPFDCLIWEVEIGGNNSIQAVNPVANLPKENDLKDGSFSAQVEKGNKSADSPPFKGGQGGVDLTYDLNNLKFHFAAPFFDSKERTLYSYQLEGPSEKGGWSGWSLHTEKEYTNLWEGRYVFRVKAKNVYGTESTEARYDFTISPPFYRTIWAYLFYACFAVMGGVITVKLNARRLQADKKRLKIAVDVRTAEIARQNMEIMEQSDILQKTNADISLKNADISLKNAELSSQKEEIAQQAERLALSVAELEASNALLIQQKEKTEAQYALLHKQYIKLEIQQNKLAIISDGLLMEKIGSESTLKKIGIIEKISRKITVRISLEEISRIFYENVAGLMFTDCCGVGVYNEDLRRIEYYGIMENGKPLPFHYDDVDDANTLSDICFATQKEIIISDLSKEYWNYLPDQEFKPVIGEMPASVVYMPLIFDGKTVGNFTVQSFKKNAYTIYQCDLLRRLANYMALAVVNSWAFHRLDVENEKSSNLLKHVLPWQIIKELKLKSSVEPRFYQHAAVMFTDFKGFTAYGHAYSPQIVLRKLDECFAAFDKIMDEFRIEKIKTIGDAYMAVAGIPDPMENPGRRMVAAGFRILEFMNEWNQIQRDKGDIAWEIRIGVHAGDLIAGMVGLNKFSYDVWGDTVNTASRMESKGEPGRINITQKVLDEIMDEYEYESRGLIEAKGKGEIEMFFVNGRKNADILISKPDPIPTGPAWLADFAAALAHTPFYKSSVLLATIEEYRAKGWEFYDRMVLPLEEAIITCDEELFSAIILQIGQNIKGGE